MLALTEAILLTGQGIQGDHFPSRPGSKRQVTLIQSEHLGVIAALTGVRMVMPEQLRRNLVVTGINLLALKERRFLIGETLLEGTSACAPCRKMEAALGPGGYQAMRGHGGICARILSGGVLRPGDPVRVLDREP
ncbi:MOSC domain-containing protein [Ferrimonas gelatinilytica]|uniref:MOSC domain-containing protein n=2 Tax=Ferrimonas gelatinilytica TaxID=1255257 RepID=A0ABP9RX04_9GAMM